jgi:membrane protein implicated in regulation of membrane protease activity
MTTLFLICATIGGTVLICQFVLSLVGLGGHQFGDLPSDGAGDLHLDFSHGDAGGASPGGDLQADGHAPGDADHHVSSTWLFGVISFRTLVAAFAFFGMAGLAAESANLSQPLQLVLAGGAGLGAMYGVHWLMRTLYQLGEDQTVKIHRAIGEEATVYIPIAAELAQAGKVQVKLQNRLLEYAAVTSATHKLATGAKVRVVGVRGNTLEVEPLTGLKI